MKSNVILVVAMMALAISGVTNLFVPMAYAADTQPTSVDELNIGGGYEQGGTTFTRDGLQKSSGDELRDGALFLRGESPIIFGEHATGMGICVDPVQINDQGLNRAIREVAGIAAGNYISLQNLTSIGIEFTANDYSIVSLEGIQCMSVTKSFVLQNNNIRDLTPFTYISGVISIDLTNNALLSNIVPLLSVDWDFANDPTVTLTGIEYNETVCETVDALTGMGVTVIADGLSEFCLVANPQPGTCTTISAGIKSMVDLPDGVTAKWPIDVAEMFLTHDVQLHIIINSDVPEPLDLRFGLVSPQGVISNFGQADFVGAGYYDWTVGDSGDDLDTQIVGCIHPDTPFGLFDNYNSQGTWYLYAYGSNEDITTIDLSLWCEACNPANLIQPDCDGLCWHERAYDPSMFAWNDARFFFVDGKIFFLGGYKMSGATVVSNTTLLSSDDASTWVPVSWNYSTNGTTIAGTMSSLITGATEGIKNFYKSGSKYYVGMHRAGTYHLYWSTDLIFWTETTPSAPNWLDLIADYDMAIDGGHNQVDFNGNTYTNIFDPINTSSWLAGFKYGPNNNYADDGAYKNYFRLPYGGYNNIQTLFTWFTPVNSLLIHHRQWLYAIGGGPSSTYFNGPLTGSEPSNLVYRSRDGVYWERMGDLPSGATYDDSGINMENGTGFSDGRHLFVFGWSEGATAQHQYISNDNGLTWEEYAPCTDGGCDDFSTYDMSYHAGTASANGTTYVSPAVGVATNGVILNEPTTGHLWTTIPLDTTTTDPIAEVVTNECQEEITNTDVGNGPVSNIAGATYYRGNYAANSSYIYAIGGTTNLGNNYGCFRSIDGTTWDTRKATISGLSGLVKFYDSADFIVKEDNKIVLLQSVSSTAFTETHSTDGGLNWSSPVTAPTIAKDRATDTFDMLLHSNGNIYVGISPTVTTGLGAAIGMKLYVSSDDGATWTQLTTGPNVMNSLATGAYRANLFEYGGEIYSLGTAIWNGSSYVYATSNQYINRYNVGSNDWSYMGQILAKDNYIQNQSGAGGDNNTALPRLSPRSAQTPVLDHLGWAITLDTIGRVYMSDDLIHWTIYPKGTEPIYTSNESTFLFKPDGDDTTYVWGAYYRNTSDNGLRAYEVPCPTLAYLAEEQPTVTDCFQRLTNIDFEQWSSTTGLTDWRRYKTLGSTILKQDIGDDIDGYPRVFSGYHSVKMNAGVDCTDLYIEQDICSVNPGDLFDLRFWARGDGTHAGSYSIYDVTNSAYIVPVTSTGVVSKTYALTGQLIRIPADCVKIRIRLYGDTTEGAEVYFDYHTVPSSCLGFIPVTDGLTGVVAGAEMNGKMYLIDDQMQIQSGYTGSDLNTESVSGTVPVARTGFSFVAFNNKLWVLYGHRTIANDVTNEIWAFDPATHTWTQYTNTQVPRQKTTAFVFQGKLMVFGGVSNTDSAINAITTITTSNVITQEGIISISGMNKGYSVTPHGTTLLLTGGMLSNGTVTNASYYVSNPGSLINSWTWVQRSNTATWAQRKDHSTLEINGYLWLEGGTYLTPYNDLWYSVNEVDWSRVDDLPAATTAIFEYNNELYAIADDVLYYTKRFSACPPTEPMPIALTWNRASDGVMLPRAFGGMVSNTVGGVPYLFQFGGENSAGSLVTTTQKSANGQLWVDANVGSNLAKTRFAWTQVGSLTYEYDGTETKSINFSNSTPTWSQVDNVALPNIQSGMTMANISGVPVLIGGTGATGDNTDTYVYSGGDWTISDTNAPVALYPSVFSDGTYTWLVGGFTRGAFNDPWVASTSVWRYDGNWTEFTQDNFLPRGMSQGTYYNGTKYSIGGSTLADFAATTAQQGTMLSSITTTFFPSDPFPVRYGSAMAQHMGHIFVAGGYAAPNVPRSDVWTTLPNTGNEIGTIAITGPTSVPLNTPVTYVANVLPIDTAEPISYAWTIAGQSNQTHSVSDLTDSATYTWNLSTDVGAKSITLTATNSFGSKSTTFAITVTAPVVTGNGASISALNLTAPSAPLYKNQAYRFTANISPANSLTPNGINLTWAHLTDVTTVQTFTQANEHYFTFTTAGVHTVYATGNGNNTRTESVNVTILDEPLPSTVPLATLSISGNTAPSGLGGQGYTMTAGPTDTTDTPVSFLWEAPQVISVPTPTGLSTTRFFNWTTYGHHVVRGKVIGKSGAFIETEINVDIPQPPASLIHFTSMNLATSGTQQRIGASKAYTVTAYCPAFTGTDLGTYQLQASWYGVFAQGIFNIPLTKVNDTTWTATFNVVVPASGVLPGNYTIHTTLTHSSYPDLNSNTLVTEVIPALTCAAAELEASNIPITYTGYPTWEGPTWLDACINVGGTGTQSVCTIIGSHTPLVGDFNPPNKMVTFYGNLGDPTYVASTNGIDQFPVKVTAPSVINLNGNGWEVVESGYNTWPTWRVQYLGAQDTATRTTPMIVNNLLNVTANTVNASRATTSMDSGSSSSAVQYAQVAGGYMYGGQRRDSSGVVIPFSATELYHSVNGLNWQKITLTTAVSALPYQRNELGMCVMLNTGKLYVIGKQANGNTGVWEYNPSTPNAMTLKGTVKSGYSKSDIVSLGSFLYAFTSDSVYVSIDYGATWCFMSTYTDLGISQSGGPLSATTNEGNIFVLFKGAGNVLHRLTPITPIAKLEQKEQIIDKPMIMGAVPSMWAPLVNAVMGQTQIPFIPMDKYMLQYDKPMDAIGIYRLPNKNPIAYIGEAGIYLKGDLFVNGLMKQYDSDTGSYVRMKPSDLDSPYNLDIIGQLAMTGQNLMYFTGNSAVAATPLSNFIKTLLDDADAATARTTLGVNIDPGLSLYRTIMQASGSLIAGQVAGLYAFGSGEALAITNTAAGTVYPISLVPIYVADYPTINGHAPKLRIRAQMMTNDVLAGGNYTVALHLVSRPATSGGAGINKYTLNAAISGSALSTVSAPAVDSELSLVGSDFDLPVDGIYCIAVTTSGTVAASAHIHFNAQLQLHNP